ncbi:MAG: sulfite exporter TauE/SafE family protein, partial [Calditrichaeota bacterium]|nr:sulfite exporter TauE/SafE family protein [Calditrichota bacterium]
MIDQALLLVVGLAAGMGGGLLGIGGGIVLMPVLRFVIGLSPAYAAGTCI